MKLPNVKGLVLIGKGFVMAHRPEMLFGASVASTLGAVVLAAKGGYEARGLVEEAQHPSVDFTKPEVELSLKEKAQLTWLCYSAAGVATITSLGSTTGLHLVHVKEKKALAQAALAAIEEVKTEAQSYIDRVIEAVDGEVDEETKEKIRENLVDPEKDGTTKVIGNTDGEVLELFLVRDPITGRDIWSNKARIEEGIVEVGNIINGSGEASLNNFYEQAGYGRIDQGELLGWSGVLPSISWVDLNGMPITGVRDDGRPYRGFRFQPDPEKDYDFPSR